MQEKKAEKHMKKIASTENKIFKSCLQLGQRKYRERQGCYIIEGPNLIKEALLHQVVPEVLLIEEGQQEKEEIKSLCETYAQSCFQISGKVREAFLLDKKLFEKISQTEHSQGIFGIVGKKPWGVEDFFAEKRGQTGNIAVLDRLQDPGNVGTIIRTADAAGYSGIMVLKGTVDVFSPKVVRACAGSLFRMPIHFVDSPDEGVELLRQNDRKIVATGFNTNKYYHEIDMRSNIALVIGNEGNGICQKLLEDADEVVKIPMYGSIESLNASVAAAILMYEGLRC